MNEQILMDLVDRARNRFYGKYRGTVTQVQIDNGVPRIKAKVPAVLGDQETGWCLPCVPYAGKDAGIAFLPETDAGVWIEFEGGDVSFPIWAGCYWHPGELPARVAAEVKVIKTPGDQQIVLDDRSDNHMITITDGSNNTVTLDKNGIKIVRGRGKIEISDGKVAVNDPAMVVT